RRCATGRSRRFGGGSWTESVARRAGRGLRRRSSTAIRPSGVAAQEPRQWRSDTRFDTIATGGSQIGKTELRIREEAARARQEAEEGGEAQAQGRAERDLRRARRRRGAGRRIARPDAAGRPVRGLIAVWLRARPVLEPGQPFERELQG